MKSLSLLLIGAVLGGAAATGFWYYSLFIPWAEQEVSAWDSEAVLFDTLASKLEAGEVGEVTDMLAQLAHSRREYGKMLEEDL